MDIEVTDEAAEVLRRSLELAGIDVATGGVRLRVAKSLGGGADVQVEFAASPGEGEEIIEIQGIRLFAAPELVEFVPHPVVALEHQHETVVVRPRGPR